MGRNTMIREFDKFVRKMYDGGVVRQFVIDDEESGILCKWVIISKYGNAHEYWLAKDGTYQYNILTADDTINNGEWVKFGMFI